MAGLVWNTWLALLFGLFSPVQLVLFSPSEHLHVTRSPTGGLALISGFLTESLLENQVLDASGNDHSAFVQ